MTTLTIMTSFKTARALNQAILKWSSYFDSICSYMDMTRLDLNETDHPVEGVYNMEIRV